MSFEGYGGDTGRTYESRFMGKAIVDPRFIKELAKLPHGRGRRFRNDEDVFRLYQKYYLGDPTNPAGIHAKELKLAVGDALGLSEDELDHLKFYSTLKTPIDAMMGVDGFLAYQESQKKPDHFVTLDATLRREKVKKGGKADVIIGELPDAVQEEDAYFEAIEKYARQIALMLQSRA